MQMVRYDGAFTQCPKTGGIPRRVDMATVAMATEVGHTSMQMFVGERCEGRSAGRGA